MGFERSLVVIPFSAAKRTADTAGRIQHRGKGSRIANRIWSPETIVYILVSHNF
jgi:hypothetical protein